MKAKALICSENQDFSIQSVTLPDPQSHQVMIRTLWSGVSIGTEFAFIREKIVRGGYPLCTGYMATGVVEYVGSGTEGYVEGDKVYFRLNTKMNTMDGAEVNLLNGSHASHAVCDPTGTTGVAHLPEGVSEDIASAFVMPGVGLHGVDISNPRIEVPYSRTVLNEICKFIDWKNNHNEDIGEQLFCFFYFSYNIVYYKQ